MSEMKSYIGPHPTDHTLTEYYLKSEADKVIAELKKACNDKDDWCLHTLKENRHHKYKRCLAMARCCNRMFSSTFGKERYWQKWNRRWLELAEKFKPNKEAK
jgi:hypothetical protein